MEVWKELLQMNDGPAIHSRYPLQRPDWPLPAIMMSVCCSPLRPPLSQINTQPCEINTRSTGDHVFLRWCTRSTVGIDYWFVRLNLSWACWLAMHVRHVMESGRKFSPNSFMTLGLTGKFVQERCCKSVVCFNLLLLMNILCGFLHDIIQSGRWRVSEQRDRRGEEKWSYIFIMSADRLKKLWDLSRGLDCGWSIVMYVCMFLCLSSVSLAALSYVFTFEWWSESSDFKHCTTTFTVCSSDSISATVVKYTVSCMTLPSLSTAAFCFSIGQEIPSVLSSLSKLN